MAGSAGSNNDGHDILVSSRSNLHGVLRADVVFQDVQGVPAAHTLNLLDQSRFQIFPRYASRRPFRSNVKEQKQTKAKSTFSVNRKPIILFKMEPRQKLTVIL